MRDQRLPTSGQDIANTADVPKEDGIEFSNAGLPAFDMDLLPGEYESYGNKVRKAHIFGQVETFRGDPKPREEQDEDEQSLVRKRRRVAGLPNTETLVSQVFFVRDTPGLLASSALALQQEPLLSPSTVGEFVSPMIRL